ncbi:hypothetical protein CEUSTIGMA_g6413.t1 [Chlamydomonas eustigma]|uniref:PI3K/PI4K catalytic domain-containing protein n=1 Tax=Chlamydomonas eustigma TaxID=1157962 RepID=A0A250X7A7_9CHLO|nr:hypothetical protein CEUSTIGMA_g6413.t1 [Chlamydomonas eustigma]|eukprot:GAX78973.1 hypothetical protein CEUSTIGMA_g6413.t1 [Chlamydomonas eustigma]
MASGDMLFGSYYAHEPGGSPSWLFQVRTNKTASGWAVVKTWCVPVLKVKQRGYAPCSPQKAFTQVKLLLAQQKLSRECGFNQIVPKLWIEPIHGIVPGHGFHIDWLGLWFDIAEGVSVQNIQESGQPPMKPELMLDIFHTINHTEIKLSALFDVLTSQCDRHQQNMFVTKDRKLMIIDNDQVYATSWRKCGFDSMILPTTQKFMINHVGFFYVLKYPHYTPEGPPKTCDTKLNPLLLLDYRCHVNNGSIGFDYPPQVQQCMANLAKKSPNEIYLEYGYPVLRMAEALWNRSRDMTEHGFEWTLLRGEPTNQPMHRYKMAPACCKMHFESAGHKYVCDTPGYHQMSAIPYGNPWHGGKWHGAPGKDTGTYVGGEGL